ncbi:MAG: helix-turn-helix domain-containing protein [bacterium]|nr:helix-turn-helix domain-containing protein [bacterium]
MVKVRNEYKPDFVTPPGDTLREVIDARGISQPELAERMNQSRNNVARILSGDAPITTQTALKLERVLGIPARFWGNRELQYREFLAREAEQKELAKRSDWLKCFPVSGMVKLGWIEREKDVGKQLQVILDYFKVASPKAYEEYWSKPQAATRRSPALKIDPYALAAWMRQGEIAAEEISCAVYDAGQFKLTLQKIKKLTLEPPEVFQSELIKLCASCGVAVTFVRELPKTACGATRWLNPSKAMIQLSLRYKSDDHLWFTFFHEAGHILLHGKRLVFVECDKFESPEESEADEFACNTLIPKKVFHEFVYAGEFSKDTIRRFAKKQGIAPGIVVGRLQHEHLLPFSHCNDLKIKFKWPDN